MDINGLNGYLDQYTSTSQTSASANKISNMKSQELQNASDEELMKVCKDFESYFLEQVFKEMEKTTNLFGEEKSDSSSKLVDYFKDSTIETLAEQSTEQNSLGLAQMLYDQMKRNYDL